MNDLNIAYEHRFNKEGNNLITIYLDALIWLYSYEESYLKNLIKTKNVQIISPSSWFEEELLELVQKKQYSKIFGKILQEESGLFDDKIILEHIIRDIHIFSIIPLSIYEKIKIDSKILEDYINNLKSIVYKEYILEDNTYQLVFQDIYSNDGPLLEFNIHNNEVAENLKEIFKQYDSWLDKHINNIYEHYKPIAKELKFLILRDFQLKPSKESFANWFIQNKIKAGLNITLVELDEDTNEYDFIISLNIKDHYLTSEQIEQSLIEYCKWKVEHYEKLKLNNAIKQKEITDISEIRAKYSITETSSNKINKLVDIFLDPKWLDAAIDYLRTVVRKKEKRAILDDNGNIIRKKNNKTIIIVWMKVLEAKGYIMNGIDVKEKNKLLNMHFPGLELNEEEISLWGKTQEKIKIATEYETDFLCVIPTKKI